ncbi:MAG: HAD family hydrolase [Gammaproteobacteria bacterium]
MRPASEQPLLEAVILDMDGVITRTATLHARAWQQLFDEYLAKRGSRAGESGAPFDIESDYLEYVDGKLRYDGVRSFLNARGIELPAGTPDDPPTAETYCGLGNRKNEMFHALLAAQGVEAYEDTLECLADWQRQGFRLAAISSSRNCREILQAAGVLEFFEVIVDGKDLERLGLPGKPAPDIFLRAAAELGVAAERAVVIEDALSGIRAARAGGFGLAVGLARHGNAEEMRRQGAHLVVDDLRKLAIRKAS